MGGAGPNGATLFLGEKVRGTDQSWPLAVTDCVTDRRLPIFEPGIALLLHLGITIMTEDAMSQDTRIIRHHTTLKHKLGGRHAGRGELGLDDNDG